MTGDPGLVTGDAALVTGDTVPVCVAVIGCGAIGSLYAAHLARVPGVEVWAVDPWAEHVTAMQARGLQVTGLADFVAPVHARTDGRDLPACDFGLVATKSGQTRAAVEGARAALASASATRSSTCWRSPASVQTRPTESPVSAASGLVAELKITFVHCGPRASCSACVRSPPASSSRASRSTARIGAGQGSNGPNQESP